MRIQDNSLAEVATSTLHPLGNWAAKCHEASLKLVRSGVLGPARVARGGATGVFGQHSWVVLGDDCYDDKAVIVDPTLWSYDDDIDGVWVGTYKDGIHTPHGKGSIWKWGRPDFPTGEIVELTPRKPWSSEAENFLSLLGPLDKNGWYQLAHAPVEMWPAGEIIDAMYESGFAAVIPIDIVGMITDRNPNGLYFAD